MTSAKEFGRMPRPQDCEVDFSASGNANYRDVSEACNGAGADSGKTSGYGRETVRTVRGSSGADSGKTSGYGRQHQSGDHRKVGADSGKNRQIVIRRYTFKLYPNKTQEAALVSQAVLLAHLWNAALEQREIQYAREVEAKGYWHRVKRDPHEKPQCLSYFDQARQLKFIRADDPDYAAMSAASLELTLKALDDAFKAFFRRAKGGAGKSSGYPRYKSPFAIEHKGADCTIWHRDNAGWKLTPHGKQYRIYAKGIPGLLKARGRFPTSFEDLEVRDMRLIRVSGTWQLSVAVKMEARREVDATAPKATVEFDLIDEFARVKIGANGECLPGWEAEKSSADERITPDNQGVSPTSGVADPETGGDGRVSRSDWSRMAGVADPETGGDGRRVRFDPCPSRGIADPETDDLQSERDRRRKKFSYRWKQEKRRIAKIKAKEARRRKEALHRWTTRLVSEVSELTVVCPPIKESTKSARGNEKFHGAAVKPVAMLNRHVLAQAPAMAIQMLEYKATEAGIPFARITPDEHALAVGRDLPAAIKAGRKASRMIRKEAS